MVEQKETAEQIRARRRAEGTKRRQRSAQRQGLFYVFCIAALGWLYWYAHGGGAPTDSSARETRAALEHVQSGMLRETVESPVQLLDAQANRRLDRQRSLVGTAAARHVGSAPRGGSRDDLRLLQQLVDQRVFRNDQVYELQALGVVLGDVMVKQLGLSWIVVDDEYGRTRALQYGDGDDVFFPITMISRRYEKNIPVDVEKLYRETEASVARLGQLRAEAPSGR